MDNKILKNFIYNIVYRLAIILGPLLTTPYISRILHSNGIGIYSYTNAIAVAFSLFAALGINNYGQRQIAYFQENQIEKSKIFWELVIARTGISMIVIAAYIAFTLFFAQYRVYLLQQVYVIVAVMFDISWFWGGIEDFKTIALRTIIVKFVVIISVFSFVKSERDLEIYIFINSMASLAGNVLLWRGVRKNIVYISLGKLDIKRHMKGILEFFIPLIAVQIYSHLDKIMLGVLVNNSDESGYYEESRKIINVFVSLIVAINTVLFPRVSNLYANKAKSEIIKIYKESVNFLFLLLFPLMAGILIVSDDLAVWFLGNEFIKVGFLLKISVPMILFMGVGNFVGMQYLIPMGKQNVMTAVYIFSAIINTLLNLWLIPVYYSVGALIASCVAELSSCLLQVILLKKSEFNFNIHKGIWKVGISAVIMDIFLLILDKYMTVRGFLYLLIQFIVGLIIYFAMLHILRANEIQKLEKFIYMKIKYVK